MLTQTLKTVLFCSFFLAIVLCQSCKKGDSNASKLAVLEYNYKKWKSKAVVNYSFSESRTCFCFNAQPVTIKVRNGAIAEVRNPDGSLHAQPASAFFTIEQLFEHARSVLNDGPASANISYDQTYGYPTSMFFDISFEMADEEHGYGVSGFVKE